MSGTLEKPMIFFVDLPNIMKGEIVRQGASLLGSSSITKLIKPRMRPSFASKDLKLMAKALLNLR